MAQITTRPESTPRPPSGKPMQIADDVQRCIQACLETVRHTEMSFMYSVHLGGQMVVPEHLRVLVDCADSCRFSVQLMSRVSPFQGRQCQLCADICKAAQESCEQFSDDPRMKACADACRNSADLCRKMGQSA